MGGYVAMAVLRTAPQVATGVILVDTRASADSLEARANRRSMLALVDREGASGVARDMMPRLLGKTTLEARADVEPLVRRLIKQQSPAAIRGAITRMMHRPESLDVIERVPVPILVVVGDEDVLTPESDARQLAAANANAELVVIPQAGHLPNLERPDALNDAVRAFLGRL
jgi:pimeloyl-ACP methyl ester carboxylesterase